MNNKNQNLRTCPLAMGSEYVAPVAGHHLQVTACPYELHGTKGSINL